MWKFDMTTLQEHEVKKWDFTWEEEHNHSHRSQNDSGSSINGEEQTHRAYAAIFLKVGAI